jgi:hypothetical protein
VVAVIGGAKALMAGNQKEKDKEWLGGEPARKVTKQIESANLRTQHAERKIERFSQVPR